MADPDFLNPSRYENLSSILHNLGDRLGIDKGKREFIYLEVDGTIYHIVWLLIQNVLKCSRCDCMFYTKDKFDDPELHTWEMLQEEVSSSNAFDWIVLLPGLFHFEMNANGSYMILLIL